LLRLDHEGEVVIRLRGERVGGLFWCGATDPATGYVQRAQGGQDLESWLLEDAAIIEPENAKETEPGEQCNRILHCSRSTPPARIRESRGISRSCAALHAVPGAEALKRASAPWRHRHKR